MTSLNSGVVKTITKIACLILVGAALTAHAVSDKQRAEIEERIQPVGSVCIEGDNSCGAVVTASGGGAKSGEDIYNSNCMACHSTGAAGAPKLGDAVNWAGRMGQGVDTLYANALNGLNAMPAKGLCMACSEDEIKATVDYILENSQ
jgi:cytochrome c5